MSMLPPWTAQGTTERGLGWSKKTDLLQGRHMCHPFQHICMPYPSPQTQEETVSTNS